MSEPPEGYRGRRTVAEILARDEELLHRGSTAAEVSVVADRGVSFGVSQPSDAPAAIRARSQGLAVQRRSSGGTGILHLPGDLVWSVVLPRTHPWAGRGYARAYPHLGAALVTTLDALGVTVDWRPSPGLSDEFCLLGRRGDALFVGPAVLGGAAQHVTGAALLHHGILGLRVDRPLLGSLFSLEPAAARGVTSLREQGVLLPAEEIAIRLARAIPPSLDGP